MEGSWLFPRLSSSSPPAHAMTYHREMWLRVLHCHAPAGAHQMSSQSVTSSQTTLHTVFALPHGRDEGTARRALHLAAAGSKHEARCKRNFLPQPKSFSPWSPSSPPQPTDPTYPCHLYCSFNVRTPLDCYFLAGCLFAAPKPSPLTSPSSKRSLLSHYRQKPLKEHKKASMKMLHRDEGKGWKRWDKLGKAPSVSPIHPTHPFQTQYLYLGCRK